MSGYNYNTAIGIQKLSQPFNLIVLGILGILCLICLVLKLLEKMIPHSKQYVFRVVMYSRVWNKRSPLNIYNNFPQSGPALQGCTVNVPYL